jgi:hypothetical protein
MYPEMLNYSHLFDPATSHFSGVLLASVILVQCNAILLFCDENSRCSQLIL